jgi:hypothetical protein
VERLEGEGDFLGVHDVGVVGETDGGTGVGSEARWVGRNAADGGVVMLL